MHMLYTHLRYKGNIIFALMDLSVNVLSTDATDISNCISIAHVILYLCIYYIYICA